MLIQQYSDKILIVAIYDDPQVTNELDSLAEQLAQGPPLHVVLDMHKVINVDSSKIGKLLKVRKAVIANDQRVLLIGINAQLWGILLTVGIDQLFEVAEDTVGAIASLQSNYKQKQEY